MKKTANKERMLNYILIYACFFVYSFASVLSKCASAQDSFVKTAAFLVGEVILLGIYAIMWQQALKKFPLVVAMSNKGVTVIFSLVWSVLFFQEEITIANLLGALLIFLGIWMVSTDG